MFNIAIFQILDNLISPYGRLVYKDAYIIWYPIFWLWIIWISNLLTMVVGYPIFWLWSLDIHSFDYGRWISNLLTMVVGYPIFWLWSLDIQSFDYGRTLWRLFKKRVVCTRFNSYVLLSWNDKVTFRDMMMMIVLY